MMRRSLSAFNQRLNLEVASREQSFNMIFKQSPNVGMLNPLAMTPKKSSKSGASSSGRLDPLTKK
jgi:hypothetical protein